MALGHLEKPGPGSRNGQVSAGDQKSARIGLIPFASGRFGSPGGLLEILAWAGCLDRGWIWIPLRICEKCFRIHKKMLLNTAPGSKNLEKIGRGAP